MAQSAVSQPFFLNLRKASLQYGIPARTLRDYINTKKLDGTKVGSIWYVKTKSMEGLMEGEEVYGKDHSRN